jgi:hypothetical protein
VAVRARGAKRVVERWIGSCRRDLLDHVIAFNERHLRRLLPTMSGYYHEDRTHLGLKKETPLAACSSQQILCKRVPAKRRKSFIDTLQERT